MRTARTVLACAAAIKILICPAMAQQETTGMITMIDRMNGTIAIQPMHDANAKTNPNAGADPNAPTEQYKVQDAKLLDSVHAGDKVAFSATGDGAKTITKLQRQ